MMSSALLRGRALVEARRRGLSASACSTSAIDGSDGSANISPTRTTLALSAYFCQPELGMKDFEILSRASAFLLSVDPKKADDGGEPSTSFPHLQERLDTEERRKMKQEYRFDPATGPRRFPHQLNWLEFLPTAFRPRVHVVASSHVVSPWLWPKYYGHEWLRSVKQEHVKYSLEVWGPSSEHRNDDELDHTGKLSGDFSMKAKFALNPYPIHHPSEMDVAIIHLTQEEAALRHIESLGIKALHLPTMHELNTSDEPVFTHGEQTLFQGYEVYEANPTDQESLSQNTSQTSDDERVFHPYSSLGTLSMCSPDRFLARTEAGPLPEGLCGGPAIELPTDGENVTIRGVVEGIVPIDHENKELAGLASFIPAYRMREFIDQAERFMIGQILDDQILLQKIVDLKEQRESEAQTYDEDLGDCAPEDIAALEGAGNDRNTPQIDEQYRNLLAEMYKNNSREDVNAMLSIIEREREQVMKMMDDGSNMDEAIAHVRRQTIQEKDQLLNEIEQKMSNNDAIPEGEYKNK